MKKPALLRAALVAALPELARNPASLIMWVDQGTVRSPMTASFSFAYAYRLHILMLGFAQESARVMIPILHWLRVNQPDLLQPGKDAITFEADFLDGGSVDFEVFLNLTEAVHAIRRPDGGFNMEFVPEPDPLFPDDLGAGGVHPIPPLSSLWLGGERILPDAPPFSDAP